jgi:hypothetical protein
MDYSELDAMGAYELGAVLRSSERQLAQNAVRMRAFIREADKRQLWARDGAKSLAAWLAERYGMTQAEAERIANAARRLELPKPREASKPCPS